MRRSSCLPSASPSRSSPTAWRPPNTTSFRIARCRQRSRPRATGRTTGSTISVSAPTGSRTRSGRVASPSTTGTGSWTADLHQPLSGRVFKGVLIDMDGKVLHEWIAAIDDIWRKAGYEKAPMSDVDAAPHGVQCCRTATSSWPWPGRRWPRLDACSRVVWSTRLRAHHSIDILPNGDILVPTTTTYAAPNPKWPRLRPGEVGIFEDQLLTRVSPDGKVLDGTFGQRHHLRQRLDGAAVRRPWVHLLHGRG